MMKKANSMCLTVFSDNMTIKIPVNNATARMRKTITKKRLYQIDMIPEQKPCG